MNEKYDIILNTKNLRKVAFAVGFGFYFGKEIAKVVSCGTDGAIAVLLKYMAKHGNETAQSICKDLNVNHDDTKKDEKEDQNKTPIGFHA